MKKVRDGYSVEFIDRLTEEFISGGMAHGNEERVRAEILKVRAKNHSALFLEMHFAVKNIQLEDAMTAIRMSTKVMEDDDISIALYQKDADLADEMLAYHEGRSVAVAKSGGDGRAAKFDRDKAETIRLYEIGKAAGKWQTGRHHVPDAALEITPQIVSFSKGRGNLVATTTMPKTWIKEHIKAQRK